MKKRMVSLLLACCLVLALLPTMASALDMNAVPTLLYVGDTNVIGGGYWKTTADGSLVKADAGDYTVYYEANSRNLTLNGADIRNGSSSRYGLINTIQSPIFAGIHTDGSLVITLVGESTIDLTDLGEITGDCAGIALGNEYQWLTFTGTGSLTVQSGKATGHSFGIFTRSSVTVGKTRGETAEYLASDNCTVTVLGGPCGYNKISAGIYDAGTLDDFQAVVKPKCGSLTAGTNYGGAGSYGVYGKVELSESGRDPYPNGNFEAFSGKATTSAALSTIPLYMPIESTAALLAAEADGAEVAYRSEDNGLYTRVELRRSLQIGASISDVEVQSVTPYTITVKPIAAASNGQIVEYALTASGEVRTPAAGWQTSPVFIGLSEKTTYEVVARTAATTEYAAGPCVRAVAVTPISSTKNYSVSTGMSVDGIAINRDHDLSKCQVGDDPTGWMTYDKDSRTLTLGGKVVITHGCKTIRSGEAVGIFCNNNLNIVLADGAEVSIDMANYARDPNLTKSLEGKLDSSGQLTGSDPITGRTTGILCQGDLTINAADDCTTMPKLTINVFGAGDAQGIRTVQQRDPSSAVTVPGIVTIGAVDVDITVGAMSAQPVISPRVYSQRQNGSAGVCGIYGGDDIILNGVGAVLNVKTVGGYQGHLLSSGEMGYGEVFMQGTEVHLKNTARNGSYRVSYYGIKWELGYTCSDSEGNRVAMKEAYWVNDSADFDPNGEPVLLGTVTIAGEPKTGETLTAKAKIQSTLPSGSKLVYTWYRYWYGTTSAVLSGVNETAYKLGDTDLGGQFYCVVTCDGCAGEIKSEMTATVSYEYFPPIYVCGILIDNTNAGDVLNDGGSVSYDKGSNTLTLKNANLTETGTQDAIIVSGNDVFHTPIVINLVGENKLTTNVSGKMALNCDTLTFIGSGSLEAFAAYPPEDSGAINASWKLDIQGDCSITTSCINNATVADYNHTVIKQTESGALVTDDLTISGNSSLFAYVDDDDYSKNTKCSAIYVACITTVKDNAQIVAKASRHEAFVTGYLRIEGGSVRAENIGSGFKYTLKKEFTETAQYAALKLSDYDLYSTNLKEGGPKIPMNNGKLEVHSELGLGILVENTAPRPTRPGQEAPNVLENIEITNSTLIASVDTENTAVIKIVDPESQLIAGDCTVYAGTDETGANATLSTKDAFLTKGSRYVRLIAGSAVDVGTKITKSDTETTVTADIAAGPGAEKEASVLIVRFNAAGKFAGLKYQTAVLSGKTWTIEASFANPQPGDTYKVYVLDGTRYVPMRNAALVHLKNV
ncbi:MAG: hypothetical protein MSC56_09315 [Clostridiales bacterium]|nr:hypothetical protein [Clostridiales bacterium]